MGSDVDHNRTRKWKKKEKTEGKVEMISCVLNMLNLRWL